MHKLTTEKYYKNKINNPLSCSPSPCAASPHVLPMLSKMVRPAARKGAMARGIFFGKGKDSSQILDEASIKYCAALVFKACSPSHWNGRPKDLIILSLH